ncbi:MAG: hypothetical protein ACOY4K_06975 [Pseudomonadota bacterium]
MFGRVSVSCAAFVLGVLIPLLEVNGTHLFNSQWPAHARLHEAWQLLTNSALSLICLWLAWGRSAERLASAILLASTGSFLVAFALRGAYGGSMKHADGSELLVAGTNPAFGIMVLISLLLSATLVRGSGIPFRWRGGSRPAGEARSPGLGDEV